MNIFEEIKNQNLVVTYPKPLNMERLAVEVFRTDGGLVFFDVGWCLCDSGHPEHEIRGKIKWVDDHWQIDTDDYGIVVIELYDPKKHPDLVMNNDTWARYLKTKEGKINGSSKRARQVFERG